MNKTKIFVVAILLIIIFFPTIIWMYNRWVAADSYYSHGFLIPIISGILIFKKRKLLNDVSDNANKKIGILILLAGILLQGISVLWRIYFTQAFAFLLILSGVLFYYYEFRISKEFLFPILFLVFMIPLPLDVISNLNLMLKNVCGSKSGRSYTFIGNILCARGEPYTFFELFFNGG